MKLLLVRGAVVAAGLVWASAAAASSPMGVYARVDKVEYEPTRADATQVVIHGVFALHQASGTMNYSGPYAGYMYFACASGSEVDCREQWREIEANIGKQQCVGWGQEQLAPGSVRPTGTPLGAPDPYDLGMGVGYAMSANGWCPKLLAYQSGTSSDDGGVVTAPDASGPNTPKPTPGSTPAPGASGSSPSPSSSPSSSETATAGCAAATTPVRGAAAAAGIGLAALLAGLRRRSTARGAR